MEVKRFKEKFYKEMGVLKGFKTEKFYKESDNN